MSGARVDAKCWNVPETHSHRAFTVVHEREKGVYVVGEEGPRPLTDQEEALWLEFRAYLWKRS